MRIFTVAHSHPSRPRALTAFTETTLPGAMCGSLTRGRSAVTRWRNGSDEGPNATMYEATPFSGLAVHDNVADDPA